MFPNITINHVHYNSFWFGLPPLFIDYCRSGFSYFCPPNSAPPTPPPPRQYLPNRASRRILLKYISCVISLPKTSQFSPICLSIKIKIFTVANLALDNLSPPSIQNSHPTTPLPLLLL